MATWTNKSKKGTWSGSSKKRTWKSVTKAKAPATYDPSKDVADLERKFKAVGVDTNKALDDRNFIEKGLNLDKDQGWVGDIFEVIDRPREALSSALTGKDAWAGFTGKEHTSGREVLGNLMNKETEDIPWWAGVATEIATDPLNLVVPIGFADDAVKGAKLITKGVDRIAMEGIGKVAKAASKPVVGLAKKVLPEATQEALAQTGRQIRRATDATVGVPKSLYNKAKEMAGLGTLKETEFLKRAENFKTTYGAEKANQMAKIVASGAKGEFTGREFVEGLRSTLEKKGAAEFYLEDVPTEDIMRFISEVNDQIGHEVLALAPVNPSLDLRQGKAGAAKIVLENPEDLIKIDARLKMDVLPTEKPKKVKVVRTPEEIADRARASATKRAAKRGLTGDEATKFIDDAVTRQVNRVPKAVEEVKDNVVQFIKPEQKTAFQNIMEQSYKVPRQALDFDVTPELKKGAEELKKLQDDIRQYSVDQGIDLKAPEGYIHKTIDPTTDLKTVSNKVIKESGLSGDPKKFQDSIYEMSPWAANKILDLPLFQEDIFDILQHSIKTTVGQTEKMTLLRTALDNPDGVAIKFEDIGRHSKFDKEKAIKDGMVVIENKTEFLKKFQWLNDNTKGIGRAVKELETGKKALVMDANVYRLLAFDKTVKPELQNLVKAYDKLMGYWKGTKLLSTGYHVRNYIGNATNMVLAGMPMQDVMKYQAKALVDYNNFEKAVLSKVYKGGVEALDANQKKVYDELVEFSRTGLVSDNKVRSEMEEVLKLLEGSAQKNPNVLKKIMQENYRIGQFTDDFNRLATWRWAKKNWKKVGLKSENEAADFVRYALFDYTDLTNLESKTLKRIFPFYTFAKKNAAFQMDNFMKNPARYANLNKMVYGTQEGFRLTDENTPEYAQDGMWMPIMTDSNGKVRMLKINFPPAEFYQLGEHPINTLINMVTPPVKNTAEIVANKSFFTGEDIEKFEGEEKTQNRLVKDPTAAYLLNEYFGGLTGKVTQGLDTAEQLLGKPIGREEMSSNYRMLPSLEGTVNPETAARSKVYDKKKALEDLYKAYQQDTGQKLPTLAELRKIGK